jgi:cyclophilin family peptidyl-prolyl cis-trans isomerase
MDVVDKIAAVKTHAAGGMDDVPVEPIVITSVAVK